MPVPNFAPSALFGFWARQHKTPLVWVFCTLNLTAIVIALLAYCLNFFFFIPFFNKVRANNAKLAAQSQSSGRKQCLRRARISSAPNQGKICCQEAFIEPWRALRSNASKRERESSVTNLVKLHRPPLPGHNVGTQMMIELCVAKRALSLAKWHRL